MTPQKIVLVIGLVAFALCVLYPPWVHTAKFGGDYSEVDAGYAFISKPPKPREKHTAIGVKIDTSRFTIQAVGIVVATVVLFLIARPNSCEVGSSGNRKSS